MGSSNLYFYPQIFISRKRLGFLSFQLWEYLSFWSQLSSLDIKKSVLALAFINGSTCLSKPICNRVHTIKIVSSLCASWYTLACGMLCITSVLKHQPILLNKAHTSHKFQPHVLMGWGADHKSLNSKLVAVFWCRAVVEEQNQLAIKVFGTSSFNRFISVIYKTTCWVLRYQLKLKKVCASSYIRK